MHCLQRVGYAFTSDRFVNTTSQRTRPYSRFAPAVSRLLIGVAEAAVAAAAAAAAAAMDRLSTVTSADQIMLRVQARWDSVSLCSRALCFAGFERYHVPPSRSC